MIQVCKKHWPSCTKYESDDVEISSEDSPLGVGDLCTAGLRFRHKKEKICCHLYVVKQLHPKLVKLETRHTVILPPMASVLWNLFPILSLLWMSHLFYIFHVVTVYPQSNWCIPSHFYAWKALFSVRQNQFRPKEKFSKK